MRFSETDCHVAFRASSEDARALRGIAEGQGVSVSELLRQMVRVVIDAERQSEPNVFIRKARRQ